MDLFDVAVLGAGPAGRAAGERAVQAGAHVALLDAGEIAPLPGAALYAGGTVWGVGRQAAAEAPFQLDVLAATCSLRVRARALVLATGAEEQVVPFAGWTGPGVCSLAAAGPRMRAGQGWPAGRTVVAGSGPLLTEVARGVQAAGGEVVAVVDFAAGGNPWPDAQWLPGCHVVAGVGETALSHVMVAARDGGAATRIACDWLCVGHGLRPAIAAAEVLRAGLVHAPQRGGWAPALDGAGRTTVPGLTVAGDAGGIAGMAAARVSGRRAAVAALLDLGMLDAAAAEREIAALAAELAALPAAGSAPIDRVLFAAIPSDCIVCPCEGVSRAQIEQALDAGVRDLSQLKQHTRCGMGPCQGRRCAAAAAGLVGLRSGDPAGRFTARIPLRPIPLAAMLGEFDYADIPVPKPAPI